MNAGLRVGSLFSGIGGLELGLERSGMKVVWQSEIDPYCSRVLAKHWPGVPNLGDVTKIEWEDVERVDLICGGFPCQPFSSAGLQRGAADPRYLWPEVERCLRVLRPRLVLLENVPGLLHAPEFGNVLGGLAACGYDAVWDCVPAAAVGAPHLRDRVWVVAYTHGEGESGEPVDAFPRSWKLVPAVADADSALRSAAGSAGETVCGSSTFQRPRRRGGVLWGEWPAEPDVGRVAHGIPCRVDRLRGLGNAVVPQVAEWIGRRIVEAA